MKLVVSKPARFNLSSREVSSGFLYHVSGVRVMNEYTIPLYAEHVTELTSSLKMDNS